MAENAQRNVSIAGRSVTMSQPQSHAGLRTPEVLGRWSWIGLLLLLVGGIAFGVVSFNVLSHGPLTQWDTPISRELPAYSQQHAALLHPLTDAGFFLGGWFVTLGAFFLLLYFSSWRYWEEFFMVLFGMVGESLLFELVNTLIARPRPPTQIWHPLNIFSFPSGHSEATVVFFGLLAYLLVPKVRSGFGKALIVILAIAAMLFVGWSRVFTAGHYLTDVVGGYALGLMWAAISYTFVELYFIQRRKRPGKRGEPSPV